MDTTLALPVTRPARAANRDRRFFLGMAAAMAAVVLVGFAPTYYLRPLFHQTALHPVFHVHGLVFTAWIVLLVVQTALVSARRTDLHRRLGVAGGALALLMIVTGYVAAITAARRGFSIPGLPPPLVFPAVPFFDLITFATFVGVGLSLRRSAAAHKRLMLLATMAVLTAGIARLPYVLPYGPLFYFGLTDLFLIAMAVHDWRTRGRIHAATLWGGLILIVSQFGRLVVSGTAAWLAMAAWLTR